VTAHSILYFTCNLAAYLQQNSLKPNPKLDPRRTPSLLCPRRRTKRTLRAPLLSVSVRFHFAQSNQFTPPAAGRPQAKSNARSKMNPKSSGARPKKTDGDGENNNSDVDTPQDGKGDPNLSGISPPLPADLVEPQLQVYASGFHVITSGTEVGITTVKCVYFPLVAVYFFTFFQRNCRFAPGLLLPIVRDVLHLETSKVVLQRMFQRWLCHYSCTAAKSDPHTKPSSKEAQSQLETFRAQTSIPTALLPCPQHSEGQGFCFPADQYLVRRKHPSFSLCALVHTAIFSGIAPSSFQTH
jgi:hypothetical protein